MKQTFKTLALVTLIGGSLTACNSNDTPPAPADKVSMDTPMTPNPSLTGTASVSGPGITGSAEITATLVDVSLINQAKYINGAKNINADIKFEAAVEVETEDGFVNIQLEDNGIVRLKASKTTDPNRIGKEYDFNETIVQDGVTYVVSGTLDVEQGTLRSDIAVVNGSYDSYYITNEGTGVQTALTATETEARDDLINNYKLKGIRTNNLDAFSDHVIEAHNQGWTGSGLTVIVDKDSHESTGIIAPHANTIAWDEYANSAAVLQNDPKREDEIITIGSNNQEYVYDLNNYYVNNATEAGQSHESALVAGGVALVWNKFDTLDDTQMIDLVDATAASNRFILADALSPVGNLK